MHIIIKNKDTLLYDEFKFKCSIGKNGTTSKKIEGDKKTPKGIFALGPVYFRKDRMSKPHTKIKTLKIRKNLGWCDDVKSKYYNKLIKTNQKVKFEKLFRKDENYDLIIPIQYNTLNPIKNKGSAIFFHLTKNYKKTQGCIAIKKKDMLILLKLINKKTKIRIL
ncbi:MAG: transpeptidase [Pelagibacteraceae bacterium TMED267]|nr:MAG: transpeptidase [Pelagibacteraceae bacterium TMED267]|tara:strand:+ start:195 stop:686 length:492 start_codon:yes stop_codon:yes gene_type:complete